MADGRSHDGMRSTCCCSCQPACCVAGDAGHLLRGRLQVKSKLCTRKASQLIAFASIQFALPEQLSTDCTQ